MPVSTATARAPALVLLLAAASGCDSEPPPRSVQEFVENPILLEAAVVRCAANRSETRYEAECINAREALKRVDAAKAEARRAELEAQSERKRRQLRRTQQAAAQARQLAAEEQRRREEAAYLAQFGDSPPDSAAGADVGDLSGNVPGAVLPEPPPQQPVAAEPITSPFDDVAPAAAAPEPNAPTAEIVPEAPASEAPTDLEAIREELRRRGEQDGAGD